jgi:hypothetical protein
VRLDKELLMDRQQAVARPYGVGLVSDTDIFEYLDPQNAAAVAARWRPRLEQLGARVLGTADVPNQPTRFFLDGIDWEVAPLDPARTYDVPATVFHRVRAAEAAEVPFAYWLWGEEQFARPTFRPVEEPKRDPVLIGVIPTAPNRGIWVCLGVWLH